MLKKIIDDNGKALLMIENAIEEYYNSPIADFEIMNSILENVKKILRSNLVSTKLPIMEETADYEDFKIFEKQKMNLKRLTDTADRGKGFGDNKTEKLNSVINTLYALALEAQGKNIPAHTKKVNL